VNTIGEKSFRDAEEFRHILKAE